MKTDGWGRVRTNFDTSHKYNNTSTFITNNNSVLHIVEQSKKQVGTKISVINEVKKYRTKSKKHTHKVSVPERDDDSDFTSLLVQ